MKNKIIVLVILIIAVLSYIGFLVYKTFEQKQVDNTPIINYECTFIATDDADINTSKNNYAYDLSVKNNIVINANIYISYYFNEIESYEKYYNAYNYSNLDGFEVYGYDKDALTIHIKKEYNPNKEYTEFLKENHISETACKIRDNNKEIKETKQASESDTKYICKKNNQVSYITVDEEKNITSIYNGTIHKLESEEEFYNIKSTLEENEAVKYVYNFANLEITQLNKLIVEKDMKYENYVENSLKGYICNIEAQ